MNGTWLKLRGLFPTNDEFSFLASKSLRIEQQDGTTPRDCQCRFEIDKALMSDADWERVAAIVDDYNGHRGEATMNVQPNANGLFPAGLQDLMQRELAKARTSP